MGFAPTTRGIFQNAQPLHPLDLHYCVFCLERWSVVFRQIYWNLTFTKGRAFPFFFRGFFWHFFGKYDDHFAVKTSKLRSFRPASAIEGLNRSGTLDIFQGQISDFFCPSLSLRGAWPLRSIVSSITCIFQRYQPIKQEKTVFPHFVNAHASYMFTVSNGQSLFAPLLNPKKFASIPLLINIWQCMGLLETRLNPNKTFLWKFDRRSFPFKICSAQL